MKVFTSTVAVLGLASLAVMPLAGQTGTGAGTGQTGTSTAKPSMAGHAMGDAGKLSAADSKFVHEAAIGGMAEVEMGQLAAEKATNPEVKQFGQRMVDDHGKANGELKALASQKGVTLPAGLDAAHKAAHAKLAKLSGAAFDRAYIQDMVKDHDKDVAAFKRESMSAADADLKAWAAKTLPTLQEHQTMVKALHSKVATAPAK